jgi:hypothetical protein
MLSRVRKAQKRKLEKEKTSKNILKGGMSIVTRERAKKTPRRP